MPRIAHDQGVRDIGVATTARRTVPLPMLAVAGPVPSGDGWAFEFKWAGLRAVVEVGSRRTRVFSSSGREITTGFPELGRLPEQLGGRRCVLDGELVALDAGLVPSRDLIRHRAQVREPDEGLRTGVPVHFYAFDALSAGGDDLTGLPYRERRAVLDGLGLAGPLGWASDAGPVGYVPPYLAGQAADVLDAARELGTDGVVAKRLDSGYHPGQRVRDWIATSLAPTCDAVVVGWKPGQGRLAGRIGALVLGANDRYARLTWLGVVGTGMSRECLLDLERRLAPLGRAGSPLHAPPPWTVARDVRWVEPALVGEVAYHTITADGRLRHVSWRGVRADRPAHEVLLPA